MTRTIALAAAALLFTITPGSRPALAGCAGDWCADSCGGGGGFGFTPVCTKLPKSARAVSVEGIVLATFPGNSLSATLAKGKAKTILTVDGLMYESGSFSSDMVSREFDLGVSVNGLAMNASVSSGPGSRDVTEDCGIFRSDPDRKCTAAGHWWLDMDDPANAALLGVPITVTLVGGDPSGGVAVGNDDINMSLTVRLEKK